MSVTDEKVMTKKSEGSEF